jgi:hypothetical protein
MKHLGIRARDFVHERHERKSLVVTDDHLDQSRRDACQRQHLDRGVQYGRRFEHVAHRIAGLILGDRVMTPVTQCLQTQHSVTARARQQDADRVALPPAADAVKEDVYRGAVR